MGVPELLKFVAKSSPNALCRVSHTSSTDDTHVFDYVLVDATNVSQTIGFDAVLSLLKRPSLRVEHAVIFVLDSQRRRVGTLREQRTHASTQDVELLVRDAAAKLTNLWQTTCPPSNKTLVAPRVLLSSRDVAGEADYKMLHMHRAINAAAFAQGRPLPSFLMVSEDSDVLCGALCGPAASQVSIATSLRDTTMDLCLLRLVDVVGFMGQQADVLLYGEDASTSSKPEAAVLAAASAVSYDAPVSMDAADDTVNATDDDVVRRKKKDGPMVATGTKVKLDDSSSDDEEDTPVASSAPAAAAASSTLAVCPPPASRAVTAHQREVAGHLRSVCVDFVFLFTMVMGNTCGVPPLTRGTTKVDMATCWQVYCQKKYGADNTVNQLLTVVSGSKKHDFKAYLQLDAAFLLKVLQSLNYSDHLSRPPVPEERERAQRYLQKAVGATLQYILACHVAGAPPLQVGETLYRCMLDTRRDGAEDDVTPSFAALMSVLAHESSHVFTLPMRGEAQGSQASRAQQLRLQTDVDTTLLSLSKSGNATSTFVSLQQLLALPSWKTLSAFVDDITRLDGATSSMGLFEKINVSWNLMTAQHMSAVQRVARAHVKSKPKETKKSAEGPVIRPASVYSFELRRMAPVLSATDGAHSSPAVRADASRDAWRRAAGLSLSYALHTEDEPSKANGPLAAAASQPRVKRTREDSGLETPVVASRVTDKQKTKALQRPRNESAGFTDAVSVRTTIETKHASETKKPSKRLGKKERMKLRAQKSSTAPAEQLV